MQANPSFTWELGDGYVIRAHREPVYEDGRLVQGQVAYTAILSHLANTIATQSFSADVSAYDNYQDEEQIVAAMVETLSWFDPDSRAFKPMVAALWEARHDAEVVIEEEPQRHPRTRRRREVEVEPASHEAAPTYRRQRGQRRLFDEGEDVADETPLVFEPEYASPSGEGAPRLLLAYLVERLEEVGHTAGHRRFIERLLDYEDRRAFAVPRYVVAGAIAEIEAILATVVARRATRRVAPPDLQHLLENAVEYLQSGVTEAEAAAETRRDELLDYIKKQARIYADSDANMHAAGVYATDYEWPAELADEFGVAEDAIEGLIVSQFGEWYGEGPGDGEATNTAPSTSGWIHEDGKSKHVLEGSDEEIDIGYYVENLAEHDDKVKAGIADGILTVEDVADAIAESLDYGREPLRPGKYGWSGHYYSWSSDSGSYDYYWKPVSIPIKLDNTSAGIPSGKVRVTLVPDATDKQREALVTALNDGSFDVLWGAWAVGVSEIDDYDELVDELEKLGFAADLDNYS